MTDDEYRQKLDELDHLLNDPEAPMQPARLWSLLAEISYRDLAGSQGLALGPAPAPVARVVEPRA